MQDQTNESFKTYSQLEVIRKIKEEVCYVSDNYDRALEYNYNYSDNDIKYTLPDKRVIEIPGVIRIGCPEVLFSAELDGKDNVSILDMALQSIMQVDAGDRIECYKNLVFAGGSSLFKGLPERMKEEIQINTFVTKQTNAVMIEDRQFAAWKGGAAFASECSDGDAWVT